MEELKFQAIKKEVTKESSKVIRVGAEIYDAIAYISAQTGLPTAQVANRLLDSALRNTVIDDAPWEANALELYKLSERKYK